MSVYRKSDTHHVFELRRNQANILRQWDTTQLRLNESNSRKRGMIKIKFSFKENVKIPVEEYVFLKWFSKVPDTLLLQIKHSFDDVFEIL